MKAGDIAAAAAGRDNHTVPVGTVAAEYYRNDDAPFLSDRAKRIIKLIKPANKADDRDKADEWE